jgi:hypothetical protein
MGPFETEKTTHKEYKVYEKRDHKGIVQRAPVKRVTVERSRPVTPLDPIWTVGDWSTHHPAACVGRPQRA